MCFFTMALGSNHHKINGGDRVEFVRDAHVTDIWRGVKR
jgi:hypothetical protein